MEVMNPPASVGVVRKALENGSSAVALFEEYGMMWRKLMSHSREPKHLWSVEELREIKKQIEDAGLVSDAIENFDPADWYDVLLDGPCKQQHPNGLKQMIRAVGEAGSSIIGYNSALLAWLGA